MEHSHFYSSVVLEIGALENLCDRRFWNHVNECCHRIIAYIQDAKAIPIFEPGGTPYEPKKHFERNDCQNIL